MPCIQCSEAQYALYLMFRSTTCLVLNVQMHNMPCTQCLGAQYASYSMDGDIDTFSSTASKDSEWIGYIFDQFYKVNLVEIVFNEG